MSERRDHLKAPVHTKRDLAFVAACLSATVGISLYCGESDTPTRITQTTSPSKTPEIPVENILGLDIQCKEERIGSIPANQSVTITSPNNIGSFVFTHTAIQNQETDDGIRLRVYREISNSSPTESREAQEKADLSFQEFSDQSFVEVTTRPASNSAGLHVDTVICAPAK